MSAFEIVPFQTERVNNALEGLIVINYTYPSRNPWLSSSPKSRGKVRGQSPLGSEWERDLPPELTSATGAWQALGWDSLDAAV
jgi:hypothetical protein